jgi:phosphatidylserine/phosphatidylglycerophosphate/cardiolipin synthase-like enzyme
MWLCAANSHGRPLLSVIGSPNFGARSVQRDSESSLVLLTKHDSPLAAQFAAERDAVLQHTHLVTLDGRVPDGATPQPNEPNPVERAVKPPLWIRVLSKLARPYM